MTVCVSVLGVNEVNLKAIPYFPVLFDLDDMISGKRQ